MFQWIVIFIINTILITNICDWFIVGFPRPTLRKEPAADKFLLQGNNRMDFQKSTECSGFSSAYVLRSYGVEADGNELYAKMPGKMRNGAVLPRNLKKALKCMGFHVTFRSGNPETLKAELCKGNRVIALVRTQLGKRWLHYVPIVGYDEKEVFIADSMRSLTNCREEYFNRRLSWEEFLRYWNVREIYMPFYRYTYLVIEKNEDKEDD